MQSWQIKALELEVSGLNHLDGFIHEHGFYVLVGLVYLLMASGIGLILLLRKSLKGKGHTHGDALYGAEFEPAGSVSTRGGLDGGD
jgi:hypothetical protein